MVTAGSGCSVTDESRVLFGLGLVHQNNMVSSFGPTFKFFVCVDQICQVKANSNNTENVEQI